MCDVMCAWCATVNFGCMYNCQNVTRIVWQLRIVSHETNTRLIVNRKCLFYGRNVLKLSTNYRKYYANWTSLLKMLCHDGKVSLASFISGVITTIFTSTLPLIIFSLELNTFQNVLLCFVGPIGIYAFFCVITYFVTNKNDFSVIFFIHLH